MNNSSLISVIIPVYNTNLFFLKKCFDSINHQTHDNLEIIIVDASSNSSIKEFILDYKFRYKDVVNIFSGKGVSFQRNIGIENATGNYISFIDSDDFVNSDYFSRLLSDIENSNSDIAFPLINKKIFRKEKIIKSWDFAHSDKKAIVTSDNFFEFSSKNAFVHPVKLYKKAVIDNARFDSSLKFGEDLLFNYQLALNKMSVVFSDGAIYSYCSEEKTNLVKKHLDSSLFRFLKEIIKIYKTRKKRKCEYLSVLPFFNEPFLNFYYLACKNLSVKWILRSLKYRFFFYKHNHNFKNFMYMFFPVSLSLLKKLLGRYN